jgi:hypothetical protein
MLVEMSASLAIKLGLRRLLCGIWSRPYLRRLAARALPDILVIDEEARAAFVWPLDRR